MTINVVNRRIIMTPALASGVDLKTNLISYWEFQNTSWLDSAPAGNTLTPSGTPAPTVSAGLVGNAVSFVTANAVTLSAPSNAGLAYSGDFSVAAWVNYPTFLSGGGTVIEKQRVPGAGATGEWTLNMQTGFGTIYPIFQVNNNNFQSQATGDPAQLFTSPNVWTLTIATYTAANGGLALYLFNGTVQAPQTATFAQFATFPIVADPSATVNIGGTTGGYITGQVDQVGFWKKVLSSAEMTKLYNGGAGLSYAQL